MPNDNQSAGRRPAAGEGNERSRARTPRRAKTPPQQARFKGRIEELEGHVYDYRPGVSSADEFTRTTEEITGYAQRKCTKYPADIKFMIQQLQTPVFPALPRPTPVAAGPPPVYDELDKAVWLAAQKEHDHRNRLLGENRVNMYAVVWAQTSDTMRRKVEAVENFHDIENTNDLVGLLQAIKNISFSFESEKYLPLATWLSQKRFFNIRQKEFESANDYRRRLENAKDVITNTGGEIPTGRAMVDSQLAIAGLTRAGATPDQLATAEEAAKEALLAIAFIQGATKRYDGMRTQMSNDHARGEERSYPRTLDAAYTLLTSWTDGKSGGTRATGSALAFATVGEEEETEEYEEGMALVLDGEAEEEPEVEDDAEEAGEVEKKESPGKRDKSHIQCFYCKEYGHYRSECPRMKKDMEKKKGTAKKGKKDSPKESETAVSALMALVDEFEEVGYIFSQSGEEIEADEELGVDEIADYKRVESASRGPINKWWILLDSQSTVNIVSNLSLVSNIRTVRGGLKLHSQAGVSVTNLKGTLAGVGDVWVDPNGIANILSLARVRKVFRVTYDSTSGNEFMVHKKDGSTKRFKESPGGLYYHDIRDTEDGAEQVALVTTVADKKSKYTPYDYSQAKLARKLQYTLGNISTRDFTRAVERKQIVNCPITVKDIRAMEDIFGPSVAILKGKTVRKSSEPVKTDPSPLPLSIIDRYKKVSISVDVMKINNIPFLMTVSRSLRFGAGAELEGTGSMTAMSIAKMSKVLLKLVKIYRLRGFRVVEVRADGQFEPMRPILAKHGIHLNTASNDEHVPEIERYIRTVKERVRCVWNSLPFKAVPRLMVREMVNASVFWINSFPSPNGVSDTMSPREIVVGTAPIDYNKHCQIEFGSYVQTHEEHDNSMDTRTVGAIALRPTGNAQGGYYFMSLQTGRRLNRTKWTPLPMPAEVIDRVHALARRSKAARNGLEFADRNGQVDTIADFEHDYGDDDESYHPEGNDDDASLSDDDDDDDNDDDPDDDPDPVGAEELAGTGDEVEETAGVSSDDAEPALPVEDDDDDDSVSPPDDDDGDADDIPALADDADEDYVDEDEDGTGVPSTGVSGETTEYTGPDAEASDATDDTDNAPGSNLTLEQEMDAKYGPRQSGYGLRPRKLRSYGHLHAQVEAGVAFVSAEASTPITDTSFKQHYVHKGLKIFGDKGAQAVIKELKQLHDMKVSSPRSVRELTKKDRIDALQYHMFLKQKRCGKIKGRGCADGRKQRAYLSKEDTTSPTVMTESLMISCIIDAAERRKQVTCDLPGAFMQTDTDERIIIKFEGPMAKLLVKVNEQFYSKFVAVENGKTVIYAELNKALYGTLKAALLFWQKLTAYLKGQGFVRNEYDWCVMNKMINGKQCTILWHVDDLKISHVEQTVLEDILTGLNSEFGKISPITITRGKVHEYLGMTLDFREDGKVKITMLEYVRQMLEDLPDEPIMRRSAPTPAANHLFQVREEGKKLDKKKADIFHHNVAKLLFLYQRARPDLKTAVSFLCTRVKSPDEDDWKKLARVMCYLRKTRHLPLVLEADNLGSIRWWVDGAFAVHPDMRSHTGAMMSLGKGAAYSASTRQKLNTTSSTEAELVAVADVMPQVLWTRYFLTAQGYNVTDNVVLQDNKSAMLLENNGKRSSGKRTRHIDIRYFFVTDRIASKEVRVEHCPTDDMIGDYFTKPLQGKKFIRFRDAILNIDSTKPDSIDGKENKEPRKVDPGPSTQDRDPRSVLGKKLQDPQKKVRWADVLVDKPTRGTAQNRKKQRRKN